MNLKSYLRGTGIGIVTAAIVLMVSTGNTSHAMTDDEIRARAKELGMTDGREVLLATSSTAESAPIEVAASEVPAEPVEISDPASGELPEGAEEVAEEVPDLVIRGGTVADSDEAAGDTAGEESAVEEVTQEEAPKEEAPSDDNKNTAEAADSGADAAGKALEGKQTTSLESDLTGEDKKKSELLADAAETENESEAQPVKTDSGFVSITVSGGMSSTAIARALQSAGAVSSAAEFDSYLCRNGYDRKLSTGEFRIPAGSSEEDIALILMKKK